VRLRHWQTRGKDGEASQEPCVPFGTKGTKASQSSQLSNGMEVYVSAQFLNSVAEGREWSVSGYCRFTP
jgi:hypothetical protein